MCMRVPFGIAAHSRKNQRHSSLRIFLNQLIHSITLNSQFFKLFRNIYGFICSFRFDSNKIENYQIYRNTQRPAVLESIIPSFCFSCMKSFLLLFLFFFSLTSFVCRVFFLFTMYFSRCVHCVHLLVVFVCSLLWSISMKRRVYCVCVDLCACVLVYMTPQWKWNRRNVLIWRREIL